MSRPALDGAFTLASTQFRDAIPSSLMTISPSANQPEAVRFRLRSFFAAEQLPLSSQQTGQGHSVGDTIAEIEAAKGSTPPPM